MIAFALVPAAIGFAIGAYLPYQAWRELASDELRARAFPHLAIFAASAASGLVLALAATLVAVGATVDLSTELLIVGAGALAAGIAQGLVARTWLPRIAEDASLFGRALVMLAAAELPAIVGIAWFFLRAGSGVPVEAAP